MIRRPSSVVKMIHLETTPHPFSISFKKNNQVMMTVRLDSDSKPNLHSDDSSLTAEFPRFTLNLKLVSDYWALSTTPADSPVEIKIQLGGHWYGGGELINQHHPLNKLMMHSAPFHTFDNGPTGLSGVMNPAWFSSNGTLIVADSAFELGINQPPADYPRFKWGRGMACSRSRETRLISNSIFLRMPSLLTKSRFSISGFRMNCRPKAYSPNPHGRPGQDIKPPSIRALF
jgi:hypothetical protein